PSTSRSRRLRYWRASPRTAPSSSRFRPTNTPRADRTGRGGGSERARVLRTSTLEGFPYLPAFSTPVWLRVWTMGPGANPGAPEHKRANLAGQPRARQRHDRLHLLLERESRGVEDHRVGGSLERRHRPGRIGAVPGREELGLPAQLGGVGRAAPPSRAAPGPPGAPSPPDLGQPAPRPLLRAGREKHLQRGVREHHRSDVPAIHHYAPLVTLHRLPLLDIHPVAHFG